MYQICGARSCKNYGEKIALGAKRRFHFSPQICCKCFSLSKKKNSELRGEIDIGLNVKLSVIIIRFKERLECTDKLLNIKLHKNHFCGSGVVKSGRTDTLEF